VPDQTSVPLFAEYTRLLPDVVIVVVVLDVPVKADKLPAIFVFIFDCFFAI
jgi:hypothetical protein